MKAKLKKLLSEKCADMGLTDKAFDELVAIGSEGLADDASDEEVAKKVDSLVPYAKAMQAEITRKTRSTQSAKTTKKSADDKNAGEGEGENGEGDDAPGWAKKWMQKMEDDMKTLKEENQNLKDADAKKQRDALIAQGAKSRGIPDYLMKRVVIGDDEDIEKWLDEYKQDLVTNNLISAEAAQEKGASTAVISESAKSWAEGLPDKK